MAVYKRSKNYWVSFSFDRIRYRKKSPDNTLKGAKAYELLLRHKLARGEPLCNSKAEILPSFKEVAIQWLETYVKNNNKFSERTNRRYALNGSLIPFFGTKAINFINTFEIEKFKNFLLNEKGLSPKTVNNYLCILSRCLKSAEEWGILKEVPKIKLLKVPPQKYDYLTEEETHRLLLTANGQWKDMIYLAVNTGLRFGELIALKWDDINFNEKVLTVNRSIVRNIEGSPKNNKSRIIPLSQNTLMMLKNREKTNNRVFLDRYGNILKHDYCRDNLHLICKAAGLRNIGWHTLRHSFASHLASRRNSIIAIKELMGHSDIKTTMRYAHINLPVLQFAINSLETKIEKI